MTWREITAEQLNDLKHSLIVDVRSPCEYERERIVGAVNIPLLSDEERAMIGIMYAEQGESKARHQALKIISPKIPDIVDRVIEQRSACRAVVIHCWRGGLRSEAVASFLSLVGIDCFRLTGGYKAWRRVVLSDLSKGEYDYRPLVLHGLTGVGKTEILGRLASQGAAVLDLEFLANHRGSVFGGIGLGEQPTQKNFDGELWSGLRGLGNEAVFLEAESRKIGKLSLPDCLLKKIREGRRILITGSLPARVGRIVDQYARTPGTDASGQAIDSLACLKERLGTKLLNDLKEMFVAGRLAEAVEILLVEYYDPLYNRQIERAGRFDFTVCGDDPSAASSEIISWLRRQTVSKAG